MSMFHKIHYSLLWIWLLLMVLLLLPGCTNLALTRATLRHAEASSDLRYQEVMENLAMTASVPSILPAFSSIYAGTTDLSDSIKVSSSTVWARTAIKPIGFATAFATQSLDFLGSRSLKQNWVLDPTIVPEKLRAMRAALQWVTVGPQNTGPDALMLKKYVPSHQRQGPDGKAQFVKGDDKGYYFDVVNELANLPPNWLHKETRACDIPKDACFWAGCHGCYVWVGADGMRGLSEFTLVMQKIARVDFASVYFPQAQTRTVKMSLDTHVDGLIADVTVYMDADGVLTSGQNLPAIPIKGRLDNVGKYAELKSVINASTKSP